MRILRLMVLGGLIGLMVAIVSDAQDWTTTQQYLFLVGAIVFLVVYEERPE